MAVLSRDAILSARSFKTEVVDVPELGGQVVVRGVPVTAAAMLSQANVTDALATTLAELVVASVVDEQGQPLFTKDDIPRLVELPFAAVRRIQNAVLGLSGMTDDSPKAGGASSSPAT